MLQVIKLLGDGGFLGPTRDPKYGGLGLDFSYSMAIAEEMGNVLCGGVPMAVGVHTGGCVLNKSLPLVGDTWMILLADIKMPLVGGYLQPF